MWTPTHRLRGVSGAARVHNNEHTGTEQAAGQSPRRFRGSVVAYPPTAHRWGYQQATRLSPDISTVASWLSRRRICRPVRPHMRSVALIRCFGGGCVAESAGAAAASTVPGPLGPLRSSTHAQSPVDLGALSRSPAASRRGPRRCAGRRPAAAGAARRRPAEPGRRGRLDDPVVLDERAAGDQVRVLLRLGERRRPAPRRRRSPAKTSTQSACAAAADDGRDEVVQVRPHSRGRCGRRPRAPARAGRRTRRRTAAPAARPRATGRRRSGRRRRTARCRRAGSRPAGPARRRPASRPWKTVIRCAVLSTIAASTTCPTPLSRDSCSAASRPATR